MQNSNFITDKQLAAKLSVSRNTIWRWVRDGLLPAPIRFGRCTRWNEASVDDWLNILSAEQTQGKGV